MLSIVLTRKGNTNEIWNEASLHWLNVTNSCRLAWGLYWVYTTVCSSIILWSTRTAPIDHLHRVSCSKTPSTQCSDWVMCCSDSAAAIFAGLSRKLQRKRRIAFVAQSSSLKAFQYLDRRLWFSCWWHSGPERFLSHTSCSDTVAKRKKSFSKFIALAQSEPFQLYLQSRAHVQNVVRL